jgi:hypothetical protein
VIRRHLPTSVKIRKHRETRQPLPTSLQICRDLVCDPNIRAHLVCEVNQRQQKLDQETEARDVNTGQNQETEARDANPGQPNQRQPHPREPPCDSNSSQHNPRRESSTKINQRQHNPQHL